MFAQLNPHSSDFGDICALYSPFLHQLAMQSSLVEPGGLWPCPSHSRRRDRINLVLLRSLYKGGVGVKGCFLLSPLAHGFSLKTLWFLRKICICNSISLAFAWFNQEQCAFEYKISPNYLQGQIVPPPPCRSCALVQATACVGYVLMWDRI